MIKQPIGIFDSGYGGLTILKDMVETLPQYDYLYLGDNARAPYGTKDFQTVYEYTLQSVKWFFDQGCSLVILACNTASAKALRTIQQNDLPNIDINKRVLGVIRPTSEIIGTFSKTKHIGVLGTSGTVQSNSYVIEIAKFFPDIKVTQEASPEWVALVETNQCESPEADHYVQMHISQLLKKDSEIDTILLGCTHYPLLINTIQQYTPTNISIISQGKIIANSLQEYLNRHPQIEYNCSKNGSRDFFTTGDPVDFNNHASLFYGEQIAANQVVLP